MDKKLLIEKTKCFVKEKILVDNISLGINEGEKIGIIGVNGTGKSTFLKIIAGVEEPDTGTITKGNRVRIEYLSQSPNYDENATVIEQVFRGNSEEMSLLRDYEEVLDALKTGILSRKQLEISASYVYDMCCRLVNKNGQ